LSESKKSEPEKISRRKYLQTTGGVIAGLAVGGALGYLAKPTTMTTGTTETVTKTVTGTAPPPATTAAAEPIKFAVLSDLTGGVAAVGITMHNCAVLAVDQINATGGIMGHPVQLIVEDTASDITTCTEKTRKVCTLDRVNAVFGGILSSEREAIRPICDQFQTLYSYSTFYEGGVCDQYELTCAEVINQMHMPLSNYAFDKFGPKIYLLGTDYNAPRAIAGIVEGVFKEKGGQTVGKEFFPMETTDFSAAIARIAAAKPDGIYSNIVGASGNIFLNQWYAKGGQKIVPNEHFINISLIESLIQGMDPKSIEGLVNAYAYFSSVDTPENKSFLDAYSKMFPGAVMPDCVGEKMYDTIWLFKKGIEAAGTYTDFRAMRNAIVQQKFQAPCGLVENDWETNHSKFPIYIGASDPSLGGRFKVLQTVPAVAPVINGYPFKKGHDDYSKNMCTLPQVWTKDNDMTPEYFYAGV